MKKKYTFALMFLIFSVSATANPLKGCKPNVKPVSFQAFKACTYREPANGQWIVDGDIPISSTKELKLFYYSSIKTKNNKISTKKINKINEELIVNTVNGKNDLWPKNASCGIRYCISKATAGAYYSETVTLMQAAANEWSKYGGVKFVHVMDSDINCTDTTENVDFDVQVVGDREYAARAFFPSNERSRRNVLITSRAFTGLTPPANLTGILRHELGHTLGFRHEHTRPEAAKCFEDNNWFPLTPYDSQSVMHYPQCGGTASTFLELSAKDISGVQAAYGPASQCEK
jgi:serine protease